MDGEWEAPQITNPACETAPGCGEWKRPMINNPRYKGKWKAPLVDNPSYQVMAYAGFHLKFYFSTWVQKVLSWCVKNRGLFILIVSFLILCLLRESGSRERSITQTFLRTCSHSGWCPLRLWAWSCGLWPPISTLTTSLSLLTRRWPTAGHLTAGGWRNWWLVLTRWVRSFVRAAETQSSTWTHLSQGAENLPQTRILWQKALHMLSVSVPYPPSQQPGIFAQLMMAAEERPWLWVIYILTVGLPVGLTVLFCWPKVIWTCYLTLHYWPYLWVMQKHVSNPSTPF